MARLLLSRVFSGSVMTFPEFVRPRMSCLVLLGVVS